MIVFCGVIVLARAAQQYALTQEESSLSRTADDSVEKMQDMTISKNLIDCEVTRKYVDADKQEDNAGTNATVEVKRTLDNDISAVQLSAHGRTEDDQAPRRHARSITLQDLRAEITAFINSDCNGVEDDAKIGQYLQDNFGLWSPPNSRPFELRRGDKETDQVVSLQALIMRWLKNHDGTMYYHGSRALRLQYGDIVAADQIKRAPLAGITLGAEKYPLRNMQYTAIKAWKENWWGNLDTQITYRTSTKHTKNTYEFLLIRKFKCPEYDPDEYPIGTGIFDSIKYEVIEDSFDVYSYKHTDGREVCYSKSALGEWLRNKNTWPNTGEAISPDKLSVIRTELGVAPRRVPPGHIRCGWSDPEGGSYRVVLTPDQIQTVNGWQIKLPQNHYSAGFLSRVADWDFDQAQDIPETGPVRERHNADLLTFS